MAQFDDFDRVPNEWRELLIVDAAVCTGLIDALSQGPRRGAAALAAACRLDLRGTSAVLDALVHLGYAECGDQGYALTGQARAFLVDRDDARYRRNALGHSAHQLRRWTALPDVMRAGGPAASAEERDLARFIFGMDDASRPYADRIVDALLAAVPDARTVLDVGGGPGTYARELAARQVATTVFDLPEVIDLVAPGFAGEPLVTFCGGDMHDGLPNGPFDLVLLANVIHSYGAQANRSLVRRAAAALASGGALAVFDFLLGISPRAPVFAVNMLISTQEGRCYREAEVRQWCEAAGLTADEAVDFPGRDEQLVIARRP